MERISITKQFETFAEAMTWADDEIASYLADSYECVSLRVDRIDWYDVPLSNYQEIKSPAVRFEVSITLEKGAE